MMDNAEAIYKRRFAGEEASRNRMWATLCRDFFQKHVRQDATIVDIGAGRCEFINNIKCARRIAVDQNMDTAGHASPGVEVINTSAIDLRPIADKSADIVSASHLFEHLTRDDIMKSLREIHRILKEGGRLLVLGPNYRYCSRDYWMFFDHITPLDDRSMREALEISGFEVVECRKKFLPFTTKSRLRRLSFLLGLYLKVPLLHSIFGQQMFIVARKNGHE